MSTPAVQDIYAPHGICFGCGPANEEGLQIKSRWEGDELVARWTPQTKHQAFEGVLNGGIVGALMDCHGNWCAATTLMQQRGGDVAPTTVTAEFHVKLKRPCPADRELLIKARPVEVEDPRVVVDAQIIADDKVQATCRAVYMAVEPGHPAYHRWG